MTSMLITISVILLVVFVAAFVLTVFLHLFVLGVPYVPTSRTVARAMVELAGLRGSEHVLDLGAGDGRILIEAKRAHPHVTATGIEYVPTIWLLGKWKIWLSRQRIIFRLGDALRADVRSADTIFLYVLTPFMQKLQEKFSAELRPGTVVVSNTFRFPDREPVEVRKVRGKTLLKYVWS